MRAPTPRWSRAFLGFVALRTLSTATFVALLGAASPAAADKFDAKVIGVADGDTLTVLYVAAAAKTPRRIRLSGIDAPEKAQAFGTVAREQLARLAFGKVGHLDCRATDRYGRSVCQVSVEGLDVGLRLVELGLAWHYKRYAKTQPPEEAGTYARAEDAARAARMGLWRDLGTAAEPVPPWDWRKASKAQQPDLAQPPKTSSLGDE